MFISLFLHYIIYKKQPKYKKTKAKENFFGLLMSGRGDET